MAQAAENPPAVQEAWVQSLGWDDPLAEGMAILEGPLQWVPSLGQEDPLEKGVATHSNILAGRNPIDREVWWATVLGTAKNQT